MNICYIDEVGTGSIFGPLLTCALVDDGTKQKIDGVKDSKQLTKKKREELYDIIVPQFDFAFGSASPNLIKKMNIHYAKFYAMKKAVEKLLLRGIKIDKIIVDGSFTIPNLNLPQEAIIKADDKLWQCSCASVLAKVKRDRIIANIGKINGYDNYDFENNAAYYSPKHRLGVIGFGGTKLHRENFEYYKYCLFCHNKYLEFLSEGKTLEEYLQWEVEQEKINNMSFFSFWKKNHRKKKGDIWI